jgi:hypothetical protein
MLRFPLVDAVAWPAMSVVRSVKPEPARAPAPGLPSRELQELWFATRRKDWKSLVVVPAAAGLSAYPLAKALGEIGSIIRMSPVQVVNAEGMDLTRIAELVADITDELSPQRASSVWTSGAPGNNGPSGWEGSVQRSGQDRAIIVASEPVVENPLALPLVLSADAVLLCMTLGDTAVASARHTIELVGRERIIGTALVR